MDIQDKCRGSLVGGAVGDALGYEVEFMRLSSILKRFGPDGISEYVLDSTGVAEFSDDTQMTLFTAEGLLDGISAGKRECEDILPYICRAYGNWYFTQTGDRNGISGSRLADAPELWSQRAPGNTCMSALHLLTLAHPQPVINNSKGCGGVMRVAPVGLYSAAHPDILNLRNAGSLAGMSAELTHKHPLSTYASMVMAMTVAACVEEENVDRSKFRAIVLDRVVGMPGVWEPEDKNYGELKSLIEESLRLAESADSDTEAIVKLGEGWVGDEALAIALFSVMRYVDDFDKCIRCAVNHGGDSDSTGAIAGNIIGAILGYESIPEKYLKSLELRDLILSMADQLVSPS